MERRRLKNRRKFQMKFSKIIINKILLFWQLIKENKKGFLIVVIKVGLLVPLLIGFVLNAYNVNNSLSSLNQAKSQKEGELSEVSLVRDQLRDITQNYEELWYDLLEKDFEIYNSIQHGEINETDAFHILYPLVHRADLLFAQFLMTSKFHRISQYIKYDIFEYLTNLLIPTFFSGEAYQDTADLIIFNIIVSNSDNLSEYLKRFSIYGEYDLNKFEEKYYLTEDNQSLYFMYEKTWEIFYNYTFYGVFNIYGNFQKFDAVIERFYVNDIVILNQEIFNFDLNLNFFNMGIILLTLIIGLFHGKKRYK